MNNKWNSTSGQGFAAAAAGPNGIYIHSNQISTNLAGFTVMTQPSVVPQMQAPIAAHNFHAPYGVHCGPPGSYLHTSSQFNLSMIPQIPMPISGFHQPQMAMPQTEMTAVAAATHVSAAQKPAPPPPQPQQQQPAASVAHREKNLLVLQKPDTMEVFDFMSMNWKPSDGPQQSPADVGVHQTMSTEKGVNGSTDATVVELARPDDLVTPEEFAECDQSIPDNVSSSPGLSSTKFEELSEIDDDDDDNAARTDDDDAREVAVLTTDGHEDFNDAATKADDELEEEELCAESSRRTLVDPTSADPEGDGDVLASVMSRLSEAGAMFPDMWTCQNPTGRKSYDSSYFLRLRDVTDELKLTFPEELIQVKDWFAKLRPLGDKMRDTTSGSMDYGGGMSQRKGAFGGRPSGGRMVKKAMVPSRPSGPAAVQLQKCDNPWVATSKAQRDVSPNTRFSEELYKNVRNILNKLTPKNLTDMAEQFGELIKSADTKERMDEIVKITFDKVLNEPTYSNLYAQLCKELMDKGKEMSEGQNNWFRKEILQRCQTCFFEMLKNDEENRKAKKKQVEEAQTEEEKENLRLELEDLVYTQRRCSAGNITFIGELYKMDHLTPTILFFCIVQLFYKNTEESIEALCKLLSLVGKRLDAAINGPSSRCKAVNHYDKVVNILNNLLPGMANNVKSSRIGFMIMDYLDLRKNNYQPRRAELVPKLTEDIAREVEEKQRLLELQAEALKISGDGFRQRRSQGGGGQQDRGAGGPFGKPSGFRLNTRSRSPMGGGGGKPPSSQRSNYSRSSGPPTQSMDRALAQLKMEPPPLRPQRRQIQKNSSSISAIPAKPVNEVVSENRFGCLSSTDDGSLPGEQPKSEPNSRDSSRSRKAQFDRRPAKATPRQVSSETTVAVSQTHSAAAAAAVLDEADLRYLSDISAGRVAVDLLTLSVNDPEFVNEAILKFTNARKQGGDMSKCFASIAEAQKLVFVWFNHVLDSSVQDRVALGTMLASLMQKPDFPAVRVVYAGLIAFARFAKVETLQMDCPELYAFFGDVLAAMLVRGIRLANIPVGPLMVPFLDVFDCCEGLQILVHLFRRIVDEAGMDKAREIWSNSPDLIAKASEYGEQALSKAFSDANIGQIISSTAGGTSVEEEEDEGKCHLNKLVSLLDSLEPVDPKSAVVLINKEFGETEIKAENFVGALLEYVCSKSVKIKADGVKVFYKSQFDKLVPILEWYVAGRLELESFLLDKLTYLYVNAYELKQGMLVDMFKSCLDQGVVANESILNFFRLSEGGEYGFVLRDGRMGELKKLIEAKSRQESTTVEPTQKQQSDG